jgi:membrane AbrB-like protein
VLTLLTLAAAAAAGLVAQRLRMPGGILVGAVLGASAVTLASGSSTTVPPALTAVVPLSIGLLTGAMVTRQMLSALRRMVAAAVLSGAAIVAAGVGVALGLEAAGLAPPAAVLATSPGALSVLVGTAIDIGTGEVQVALFHVVRLLLVVLLAPALVVLQRRLPGPPR